MALQATIHGRVQGVGFREATRRRALELGIRGWVCNQADGSVLVHAEGDAAQLDSFREFLGAGPRAAEVRSLEPREVPEEGHQRFVIRD